MQSKKAYNLKKELLETSSFTLYKILLNFRSMYFENLDKKIVYKAAENHYFYNIINNISNLPVFIHLLTTDQPISKIFLTTLISELEEAKNTTASGFGAINKHLKTFEENKNTYNGYLIKLIEQLENIQKLTKDLLAELTDSPFEPEIDSKKTKEEKQKNTEPESIESQKNNLHTQNNAKSSSDLNEKYPQKLVYDPSHRENLYSQKVSIPTIAAHQQKNDTNTDSAPGSSTPSEIDIEID